MLKTLLIFLLSLILAVGATFVMYEDEVDSMIQMGQDKIDEIINGEKPEPDGGDEQDELKVESIALDTTNVKLVFNFGEEFTAEGLKVIATLEDGSTKDVALADCKIVPVDTTKAGQRQVTIVYEGKSARYEITVNAKVIPPISETPLVDITAPNDSVPYRVEAELIDMAISGVVKAEGVDSFVAVAPEGADITSGDQYLTGFGVAWNYFGFTFNAAQEYKDVIIVLRVANSTAKDLDAGVVKMFLNFAQDENGKATGAIALDGFIVEANGAGKWTDIVLRNVTIPQGTNTLTFETQKDNAFDIDYVDFYVGMRYVNSVVEINDTTTIVKDLENFDTEKAFTRVDVANAHGLKDGQLFVENVAKESPGKSTNGGSSVGAIGKGSQMSTTIRLAQDSTVRIMFKASSVGNGPYNVADNWNFYIDGVKLNTVEVVNIEGGDPGEGFWWDWKYTNVGEINLTAGDHFFLLEVHGKDCNVDTVEFEIVSLGSFDESGKNLEDMVQPEEDIESDLVINGKGDFVFEAEDLDISGLTPSEGQTAVGFETPSGDGPATSGGQSLGKAGGGSASFTFTLEDKATIQIYGRLAHAHGGVASTFMSAKLGDTELALSGDLPVGVGNMPYWNWADIPFGGELELEAGTYTLTVTFLKNPNVDCFKIKVLSYGDEADEDAPFATIEAETFDNEGVVTRQDFIDILGWAEHQYGTETANGATCIYGFTSGTYFKFNLNLAEAKTLEMFLVGATDAGDYNVSTKLTVTVNGQLVTIPSGLLTGTDTDSYKSYHDWQTVSLGVLSLNAGDNEIVLTIVDGHPNLDKVFFVEAEETPVVPEHSCESICPECGKCLDAECAEAACAEKCQGHQVVVTPDITITDASDSYKAEAEELDMSTLVPQVGFAVPVVESFDGGKGLGGIGAGGYQSFIVTTDKDVTVNLCISFANAGGGSILNFIPAVYVNGNALTLLDGQVPAGVGTPQESVSNFYWNVANVHIATVDLVAGETYTFKIMVNSGNLDGYVLQVVENAPAHECESICPECGKCLDAECAEAACAEKCQGHQVVVTPNITITDASNSYKVEAEGLDISTLVPQPGFETPKVESFAGGQGLGGIAGGYQTFIVTTDKDVTVALNIAFAKYEGGSILSFVTGVSVNGESLTLTDGQIAPGTAENQWWNVSNVQVATIDLEAGKFYTFQIGVNSGNLDGYVLEVVENVPAHECESVCTACGKCTDSECAEAACESKCAGHAIDAEISADNVFVKLEAESWNYADDSIVTRSDFIEILGWTQGEIRSEAGNGANCVYGFTAGTKFVLNINAASDMTVDLLLRGATDAAGYDASKLAVTLNGNAISGAYGSLTGSVDPVYWDWQTVCLGRLDLVQGVNEITITVSEGHPNIDFVKLVPVDADITVAASGTTTLHMENFDEHKSSIDSKDDFVAAYAGQGFKEGDVFHSTQNGRIYGFNASTFVMHVEVKEACTLKISVNLWNCNALNTYKYYFNGQAINCTNETAPTGAGVYEIGSVTVSEAGIYTFIFTTGGVDFDEVIFTVVE